ncbi:hypothetical protein COCOR_00226 [Corallococcus coralloides DSM 2259]|uniref:DUF3137 domain-containing protein n=1 Tax=Corallococcus coralloides (strain ATCC 25202 / DSM 2259 / NBRC 100086 / M2) TaxID=1144275 RepID=H8MWL6_CORCM|nr:hypothetical protein [Corallococcus coralloides]AFE03353.1 hypothetical protein COCOR_00226 [Corallococcus coralloides DSM 2259]
MAPAGKTDPEWNTLELRAPVDEVLRALDAIPQAWAAARWKRRKVTFAVLGGIALCAVAGAHIPSGEAALPAGLLAFGLAVVLLFYRLTLPELLHEKWKPSFSPDRRRLLAIRVLKRLQADLPPAEPVHLRLLLLPWPNGPGSGVARPGYWKEMPADWLDAWLLLETRLADGAHLRLSAVERRRYRLTRWPGNFPGYLRTKHRDVLFMDLQLRVKPERHPKLAALTESRARSAVRLPRGAQLQRLRVAEDRLRMRVRCGDDCWVAVRPKVDPNAKRTPYYGPDMSLAVTQMLLSLYQMLHVARLPPPPPEVVPKPKRDRKAKRSPKRRHGGV